MSKAARLYLELAAIAYEVLDSRHERQIGWVTEACCMTPDSQDVCGRARVPTMKPWEATERSHEGKAYECSKKPQDVRDASQPGSFPTGTVRQSACSFIQRTQLQRHSIT